MKPLLSVQGVSVRFGSLSALHEVTMELQPGSAVGLIGPNGAGKSTLLGVIGGQQRTARGRVEFQGRDISRMRPDARARLGLRRTFQSLELFDDMSVRDNILAAIRGLGLRTASRAAREPAFELIRDLGLEPFADTNAGVLPAPIRRIVSYARAVVASPECVLLDEPAAGLSEPDRNALAARIKNDVEKRGMSAVVVEHNMGFVRHLCSHIYFLNAGALLTEGTFDEVASNPNVREAYLGRPSKES
jgi:ABC-type branched-subunit amino acid transport system ATPase component